MTISDKIRIYELSRDLNLENKDILDAAQKLSISVKSHSSSISAEEAKKIKNLINKKNPDKQILSINKGSIKELKDFNIIRPEKKFGKNTRFDFFLQNKVTNKKAFLEVKSVSLQRKNYHAEFPDSVTSRGKKHLENLVIANKQGYESYLFFLIQIEKCKSFAIASDIDPEYFKVFNSALKKNINVICYDCKFTNKGIEINKKIDLINEW